MRRLEHETPPERDHQKEQHRLAQARYREENQRALNVSSWEYRHVTLILFRHMELTKICFRHKKKWEKAKEQDDIHFEEMLREMC